MDRSIEIGGVNVPLSDRFDSEGGASIAKLGWSQRLGDKVALGATVGAYVGRLDQVLTRTLDSLAVGGDIQPFVEEGAWRYSGKLVTLGARLSPSDFITVSGAAEWSGDLTADPQDETGGGERVFDVPVKFSAGLTAALTSRVMLNVSAAHQDWSGADGFDPGATSDDALSYGAGLEWVAIDGEGSGFPIRLGYRHRALPFRYDDSNPTESAFALGLGLNLVQAQGTRFGWIDLAVERGDRSSGLLEETFWRATVSIGISQF